MMVRVNHVTRHPIHRAGASITKARGNDRDIPRASPDGATVYYWILPVTPDRLYYVYVNESAIVRDLGIFRYAVATAHEGVSIRGRSYNDVISSAFNIAV